MHLHPLDLTFQLLVEATNPAAVEVLATCLEEDDAEMQTSALRALLARPESRCLAEIVRRWPADGRAWAALVEPPWQRFEGAVREALLSADPIAASAAGRAAIDLELFEVIPVLVHASERHAATRSRGGLAKSLLALVRLLHDRRRGGEALPPPAVLVDQWQAAGRALAASVEHFSGRRQTSILLAWLLAADWRPARFNLELRASLRTLLMGSREPEALDFLLGALVDFSAPEEWAQIAAARRDAPMLRRAIERTADQSWSLPKAVGRPRVRWFHSLAEVFCELDASEQVAVARLARLVEPVRPSTDEVLAYVAANGLPAARLAALHGGATGEFAGTLADVESLRHCRPGDVAVSVRGALADFKCESLLAAFDELDEEEKSTIGGIVSRTDPETPCRLGRELASDSPARRRRALAVAAACEAVDVLMGAVLEALADSNPSIRVAAAEALARSRLPEAREGLMVALTDTNLHVQLAAERSLAKLRLGRGQS